MARSEGRQAWQGLQVGWVTGAQTTEATPADLSTTRFIENPGAVGRTGDSDFRTSFRKDDSINHPRLLHLLGAATTPEHSIPATVCPRSPASSPGNSVQDRSPAYVRLPRTRCKGAWGAWCRKASQPGQGQCATPTEGPPPRDPQCRWSGPHCAAQSSQERAPRAPALTWLRPWHSADPGQSCSIRPGPTPAPQRGVHPHTFVRPRVSECEPPQRCAVQALLLTAGLRSSPARSHCPLRSIHPDRVSVISRPI